MQMVRPVNGYGDSQGKRLDFPRRKLRLFPPPVDDSSPAPVDGSFSRPNDRSRDQTAQQ